MKNKKPNQPTEFVRKTNEEILEAMKHAMRNSGGDPEITEILLKLMTFTPEEDAPKKSVYRDYGTELQQIPFYEIWCLIMSKKYKEPKFDTSSIDF